MRISTGFSFYYILEPNAGSEIEFSGSFDVLCLDEEDEPEVVISTPSGYHNSYGYVDLGLPSGTLWATMNVGADSPEDYGDYFAWGEIQPKSSYTLENYKWYDSANGNYTKYIIENPKYYIAGIGVEGSGFACDLRWDPSACPLTNGTVTYKNLPVGDYEFKITDGSWTNSWGLSYLANDPGNLIPSDDYFDNIAFTLTSVADVTISFDGEAIFIYLNLGISSDDEIYSSLLIRSDDAANANWGDSWRMPTNEEIDELVDNCTWTWISQNGVNGYKVSSKVNGNSIFLPAAGCSTDSVYFTGNGGYYWCSSLDTTGSADYLCIVSDSVLTNYQFDRYGGLSIRPVLSK
jgi:hypothetical protein